MKLIDCNASGNVSITSGSNITIENTTLVTT